MPQLVECVPNFSEGKRPEIYNAIADSIRTVPGVNVLDVSADPDHNRCVITFVGAPAAVEEGAFRAIATAAELINLDEHTGEHPRIGATDVCPFIPVKGISVEECVELAKRLGQRVGEQLGIAVYLYGAAATRPEREKLAAIRQGEYERWKEEVATNPGRKPDFGPAVAKPHGPTVIGVRPFLIAYNLFLNTDQVEYANNIARAIRFSSGGLRHVQALGFLVEGQAQVSMNLTDFNKTAIHHVQEMVRREAAQYGLTITRAELIGLIPEKALLDSAKWYLQLTDIDDDQILELGLAKARAADPTPLAFIEATAAGTPTPGGGSTAALAGALGAALTQMVSQLTVGRKKYQAVQDETMAIQTQAAQLGLDLTQSIQKDSAAFTELMAAWKDTTEEGLEKEKAIEQATIYAAEVPLAVAKMSHSVANLARTITEIGNLNAVTDAAAGALMAQAAVQIAAMNVKINAKDLKDQSLAKEWSEILTKLEIETSAIAREAVAIAAERGGF